LDDDTSSWLWATQNPATVSFSSLNRKFLGLHELEVTVKFWDKIRLFYYKWFQTFEVTFLDPCPTS